MSCTKYGGIASVVEGVARTDSGHGSVVESTTKELRGASYLTFCFCALILVCTRVNGFIYFVRISGECVSFLAQDTPVLRRIFVGFLLSRYLILFQKAASLFLSKTFISSFFVVHVRSVLRAVHLARVV